MSKSKRNLFLVIILISFAFFFTMYSYEDKFKKIIDSGNFEVPSVALMQESAEFVVNGAKQILKYHNVTSKITVDNGVKELAVTEKICLPKHNIAFFKMHKCSSSTVQNILFRYGDSRDLMFVLPVTGNYLGYDLFDKRNMIHFPTDKYSILCHHTRFSYKGMKEVMPVDTEFVTIIRDPVTMFESIFTYVKYDVLYGIAHYDDPLGKFLENPNSYYEKHGAKNRAKNPMLFDLGLPIDYKTDTEKIDALIKDLSDQFNLVMITEYFDESLILLKELMCWSFDDIVYVVLNARAKDSVKPISIENAEKIRQWSAGDCKVYDHFNKTFWGKIESFGKERMAREVAKLHQRKQYYTDRCISAVIENDKKVWHPHGIHVESFRLKPEASRDNTCVRLIRTELPYTDFLRRKQIMKFKQSKIMK